MVKGPVHFIHLGGPFLWQHRRAVVTAEVHGSDRIIWAADPFTVEQIPGVEIIAIKLPNWLRDHAIGLANVKDLYVWELLHEHGGLYLDLDTISLRPIWDLLTRDVLVSTEWPRPEDGEHLYNSAVVAARAGAPVLRELEAAALATLETGESRWGKTGPHLLTLIVRDYPESFDAAPFGVLNGWRDDTIIEYYQGARPGPDVRIIHLYSSSRPELFAEDKWWPSPIS